MVELLVKSVLSISLVLCLPLILHAQASPLSQSDLLDANKVVAKLQGNVSEADKRAAEQFHKIAQNLQNKKNVNWPPVLKAYGESAIYNPTPKTLLAYAYAHARWFGNPKNDRSKRLEGLALVINLYDSAISADQVVPSFSPEERTVHQKNLDGMKAFLENETLVAECPPLKWLGLMR